MNEKPIRRNTIVSTTDKRLTLLQWLKQVQGQLKDLKEKGVKAVVEEFDTPEAFYNAYATKPAGEPVLAIVGSDTAIYGTLNDFTDKVNVKGIIYQGDKVYTSAEADALSIVGADDLASMVELNTAIAEIKTWKPYYFNNAEEFALAIKNRIFKKQEQVLIVWHKSGDAFAPEYFNMAIGTIRVSGTTYIQIDGISVTYQKPTRDDWRYDYKTIVNPTFKNHNDASIDIQATSSLINSLDLPASGIFSPITLESSQIWPTDYHYGIRKITSTPKEVLIGGFQGISKNVIQGILIDETNKEIYYSVNGNMTVNDAGVVENAISGTQLKEAVQRANQKTYWHSVKIKGANGIFTFNAPSTLNTPIVSTEKLLELFNNDTWAGFGKVGTDMLFAIRLLNGNIEFIKVDDTKVSIGAFGTLDISDDVKEVK